MPKQDVSIARYFAGLPDPRVERTRKHRLDDILVIALCAVICGADTFEEVERFEEDTPALKSYQEKKKSALTVLN